MNMLAFLNEMMIELCKAPYHQKFTFEVEEVQDINTIIPPGYCFDSAKGKYFDDRYHPRMLKEDIESGKPFFILEFDDQSFPLRCMAISENGEILLTHMKYPNIQGFMVSLGQVTIGQPWLNMKDKEYGKLRVLQGASIQTITRLIYIPQANGNF